MSNVKHRFPPNSHLTCNVSTELVDCRYLPFPAETAVDVRFLYRYTCSAASNDFVLKTELFMTALWSCSKHIIAKKRTEIEEPCDMRMTLTQLLQWYKQLSALADPVKSHRIVESSRSNTARIQTAQSPLQAPWNYTESSSHLAATQQRPTTGGSATSNCAKYFSDCKPIDYLNLCSYWFRWWYSTYFSSL